MLKNNDYQIGTLVTLKKPHPSGTKEWVIVRLGADIKLQSTIKKTVYIMFTRQDFKRKVKTVKNKHNQKNHNNS